MNFHNLTTQSVFVALLFTPGAVLLAQDAGWITGLIGQVHGLLTQIIPLLIGIALLVFIWGIVLFIAQSGNEQAVAEGKRKILWGIVALFIIVSIWGFVALLQQITGINSVGVVTPSVT